MKPTDGLKRGAPVKNLGRGIQVPVGNGTLGHVFNVIGEPLDTGGADVTEGIADHWGIHRPAPAFDTLDPQTRMFETGIKVVDLLEPYVIGGKTGLLAAAAVGRRVLILERITGVASSTVVYRCSRAWVSARVRATTCGWRWPSPVCSR